MATTALNFWIPVRYEHSTLLGTIDDYFHLKGDVAIVTDSSDKVQLEHAESPLWLTVIKVVSYTTLIIPILFFIAKYALRSKYSFHIVAKSEKESPVSFRARSNPAPNPVPTPRVNPTPVTSVIPNPIPASSLQKRITPTGPGSLILPHVFHNTEELLRESEDFFNNYSILPPLSFESIETHNLSLQDLAKTLLEKYDGLCIGENHDDSSSKYFLSTRMFLLKELGVDVIYLEGYEGLQEELDLYFSGSTLVLPDAIKDRLSLFHSTGPSGYNECDVLTACKEAGIRMVNIESVAARGAPFNPKISRIVAMNY